MIPSDDWETILDLLDDEDKVTADDLPNDVKIADMGALVELGWLERTAENPATWAMGWKAQVFTVPAGEVNS